MNDEESGTLNGTNTDKGGTFFEESDGGSTIGDEEEIGEEEGESDSAGLCPAAVSALIT